MRVLFYFLIFIFMEWYVDAIVQAFVPAFISWIVSYFTVKMTLESERLKLRYDYDKLLVEERMKYYPELFAITQNIWKQNKTINENIWEINKAYELLLEWRKRWWFLLLTEKSLKYFNDLKVSLKADPWNGEKWWYTKEQLKKIWQQRNNLRWALKDDIWIKIENYKD